MLILLTVGFCTSLGILISLFGLTWAVLGRDTPPSSRKNNYTARGEDLSGSLTETHYVTQNFPQFLKVPEVQT